MARNGRGLSKELSKIAEYFIHLSDNSNRPMVNLKLQKLVYYAQAWNLVFYNKKLYNDPIEAWIHGPAVHNLWRKYKKFGFKGIEMLSGDSAVKELSNKTKTHLKKIWDSYGGFDARYLETLTHYEKPWQEARMGLDIDEASSIEISTDTMKEYYTECYNKYYTDR